MQEIKLKSYSNKNSYSNLDSKENSSSNKIDILIDLDIEEGYEAIAKSELEKQIEFNDILNKKNNNLKLENKENKDFNIDNQEKKDYVIESEKLFKNKIAIILDEHNQEKKLKTKSNSLLSNYTRKKIIEYFKKLYKLHNFSKNGYYLSIYILDYLSISLSNLDKDEDRDINSEKDNIDIYEKNKTENININTGLLSIGCFLIASKIIFYF
jgi:hypothetical protein